uniref:RNA helicase n=1 Tax=Meloidogyne javanica TaxID=6303 RepID=A0A915LUP9_MELJA
PYDCIAKKDLYNHDELENSFKISENNSKNGFTELNRIYALNKAIKSLCEFKNFSAVKHESLLKKFLESKGTWENQGNRNQAFEEEIYQTSSLPVDETYFKMDDSISVDIERFSSEYNQVSKINVTPIENFDDHDLDLHQWLMENIYLSKFKKPTPVQRYAIRILTFSYVNDLIAVAETGSGKTAAFLIPLIDRLLKKGFQDELKNQSKGKGSKKDKKLAKTFYPKALILLPTRELAQQTYREVMKLTYRTPLVPALVYGGHNNYAPQLASLKWGCDILVATPLRLIEMMKNLDINLSQCTFFVMDESDRLLDSTFVGQTGAIIQQLPAKEERTTVMFSATYDNKVVGLVDQFLRNDHVRIFYTFPNIVYGVKLTITRKLPPNLYQSFYWIAETMKYEGLKNVINRILENSIIVKLLEIRFYEVLITIEAITIITFKIKEQLIKDGYPCLAFHGDVGGPKDREKNLNKFKSGEIRLLIASDALARGIDIGDITHVINFDTPQAYQNYVHRIGRTARVGREGTSVTFVNEQTRILMDLYNSIENKNVFPQEMSNRVYELKQKQELAHYNQQMGASQLDPYRSSYSGGSQRYLLGNPDLYTHEVENYNEPHQERIHDDEYYDE